MIIVKLDESHASVIRPLFYKKNYMEKNVSGSELLYKEDYNTFCLTYLSGLTNYHAFGTIDYQNNLGALISCYQSSDEPAWYGTHLRSTANNLEIVKQLLDKMIEFNEDKGRLKFYTLWSSKQVRLLRRFAFSDKTNERYDYFDELMIPAKTRCFYNNYWQILFNRILLPNDTIIRCSFLKQKYRNTIPIGGNI